MKRTKHNLSHYRNTTCNMGQLVPIMCEEVIQGDTFKHNTNMFMRLSPLVRPVMHPVHARINHYFVPYRILWDKWEDFITGGEDFDDASVLPFVNITDPVTAGSLLDQLGVPVGFTGKLNCLKIRAYFKIWNDIYRDDQLQDKVEISLESGEDTTIPLEMLNANWGKDPFTTARPDDQLGTEVTLPLGNQAPVKIDAIGNNQVLAVNDGNDQPHVIFDNGGSNVQTRVPSTAGSSLYADLTTATGATLDELRMAIATQRIQEIINLSGNTYPDWLRRSGIKYSDARLQRTEYLGGGKQTIQFSEVLQTAEGADTAVGDLKGHGIAALRSNNYMKMFEEPGVVISLLNVKPIPMYTQALHKKWFRETRDDFYQKEMEILPMQEILNKQVKHDHTSPDATFGYEPKFQEYRRIPNTVHGRFATTHANDWHMAREFDGDVALNDSFITCQPTDRVFAYQGDNDDQLYLTVQHKLAARRLVRKYANTQGLTL